MIWKGEFVEENNLSVLIAVLRKALGEKKNAHSFIATVPGKGCKFVVEISKTNKEILIENLFFFADSG